MLTSPTEVTVYTWPYQWVYWPMYRALYEAGEEIGIRFKCEVESSSKNRFNDDEHILQHIERKSDAVALCAPPPREEKTFRSITLLWRLPHWIVTRNKEDFDKVAAGSHSWKNLVLEKKEVRAFAEKSTSGNFVRSYLKPLGIKELQFPELNPADFVDRNTNGADLAMTFIPFHRAEPSYIWPIVEFSGVTKRVSSLLIPDAFQHLSVDGGKLYERILKHLKSIVLNLYETQGLPENVTDLVTRMSVASSPPKPPGLSDQRLQRLLSEYINHMAYFPYQLIDRVLGSPVRGIVEATLQNSVDVIVTDFRKRFRRLLAPTSIGVRSFEHRREAHQGFTFDFREKPDLIYGDIDSPKHLWDGLRHLNKTTDPIDELIERTQVQVAGRRGSLSTYYDPSTKASCEAYGLQGALFDNNRCSLQIQNGSACFLCGVCGYPETLLVSGIALLRRELEGRFDSHQLTANLKDDDSGLISLSGLGGLGTVLHWSDLEPVFSCFGDELRCNTCHIHLGLAYSNPALSFLLAIFAKETSGGTPRPARIDESGTRMRLRHWIARETQENRQVDGVYLWWRDNDNWEELTTMDTSATALRDNLWHNVPTNVKADNEFAYVIVYKDVSV